MTLSLYRVSSFMVVQNSAAQRSAMFQQLDTATPSFSDVMKLTLTEVRQATGISLAFGGPVNNKGEVKLTYFSGRTVGALSGVRLSQGRGLGGKAAALQRVISVNDYFSCRNITHDYDHIIDAEGLRSLVSVPLIVRREVVGMIYGAMRNDDQIGGRIEQTISIAGRSIEQAMAVQEIVAPPSTTSSLEAKRLRKVLRNTHVGLIDIIEEAPGKSRDDKLLKLAERLLEIVGCEDQEACGSPTPAVHLTKREKDVLRLASSGLSNRTIAETLGLRLHTVKGYMKTAMAKLGGKTRLEAVVIARTAGLIL